MYRNIVELIKAKWHKYASVNKPSLVDNGFVPNWCQAIIWTNDGTLLIGPFSEILSKIDKFLFKKMHLKMSAKWRQFYFSLNGSIASHFITAGEFSTLCTKVSWIVYGYTVGIKISDQFLLHCCTTYVCLHWHYATISSALVFCMGNIMNLYMFSFKRMLLSTMALWQQFKETWVNVDDSNVLSVTTLFHCSQPTWCRISLYKLLVLTWLSLSHPLLAQFWLKQQDMESFLKAHLITKMLT